MAEFHIEQDLNINHKITSVVKRNHKIFKIIFTCKLFIFWIKKKTKEWNHSLIWFPLNREGTEASSYSQHHGRSSCKSASSWEKKKLYNRVEIHWRNQCKPETQQELTLLLSKLVLMMFLTVISQRRAPDSMVKIMNKNITVGHHDKTESIQTSQKKGDENETQSSIETRPEKRVTKLNVIFIYWRLC